MEHCVSYNPAPIPPDGSVTTAKLGGDVTAVAKELLQAETKPAQRAAIELPNLIAQERF